MVTSSPTRCLASLISRTPVFVSPHKVVGSLGIIQASLHSFPQLLASPWIAISVPFIKPGANLKREVEDHLDH